MSTDEKAVALNPLVQRSCETDGEAWTLNELSQVQDRLRYIVMQRPDAYTVLRTIRHMMSERRATPDAAAIDLMILFANCQSFNSWLRDQIDECIRNVRCCAIR